MEKLELFHTLKTPKVYEREIVREDGTKSNVKAFEGYAIVFNEPSVVMVDWWDDKVFREYIDNGAISQQMLDTTDIVCTAFHNREKLLARHHADGTGTLKLEVDEVGVKAMFDFPNGPLGDDIAEAVSRGDMPGMSFSFYESDYTYSDVKGADGIIERHISKIDSIFEVTVASNPAYPATTANCREAWNALTKNEEDLLKQKQDEEKAERERLDRIEREHIALQMQINANKVAIENLKSL